MFKKIVAATDFSPASRAALHGCINLATKCLAKLCAIHVVTYVEEIYNLSRFLVPNTEWKEQIRAKLDHFFPEELYPNSEREILTGTSIAGEILGYAKNQNIDLIGIGTRGSSQLENLVLGSVAQKLIQLSSIPVMVVRDVLHTDTKYQGASRVLVPTDFSETSKKAMEFGISLANFLKADFHLLHSIDLPAMKEFQNQYPFAQTKLPETCELNVDPVLNSMIKEKKFIGNPITATVVGDPMEEILKYAKKERIDFIVIGRHGKKGLERILLGSVASGIVSRSDVPVITVSPF